MKNLFSFLFLILVSVAAFGQSENTLIDRSQKLTHFAVLPDHGYTFSRIQSDQKLKFTENGSLKGAKAYWIRFIVVNSTKKYSNFRFRVFPNWHTTLFTFDTPTKKWHKRVSLLHTTNRSSDLGVFFFELPAEKKDTLYLRVNIDAPNIINNIFKVQLTIEPKATYDQQEENIKLVWLIALATVFVFFLHKLYIYFSFRDNSILYYLVIQIGGAIYLTAYWRYFRLFFSIPTYSFSIDQKVLIYDRDSLLEHAGIVIFFYGFIELTRSYLNTKQKLPFQDRLLKYLLWIYIVLTFVFTPINVFWFNIEYYTVYYDNVYCAILILAMLYTCIVGYQHKIRASGSFLSASLVFLIAVLTIPLGHILMPFDRGLIFWLPTFVIVSQALFYSIALVSRTKLIREDLKASELESKQLAFDLREVGYLNKLNEKEMLQMNAKIQSEKERNELLKERLEINQRELASSTLYTVQKNELLAQLKNQIRELNRTDRYLKAKHMEGITALLDNNLQLDADWGSFKIHFEQVHPNFFEKLNENHPALTQKEVRLYAYFHMKLSHKEIAALLGIDPASVRRAKTRLLKKIGRESLG